MNIMKRLASDFDRIMVHPKLDLATEYRKCELCGHESPADKLVEAAHPECNERYNVRLSHEQ